jgi:hypothetical protein
MNRLIFSILFVSLVLASCSSLKKANGIDDDVYASPKEYRAEEARIALQKKQQEEARVKRYNDSINDLRNALMQKDANNPYYQDREFSYDDYYDHEYATRLRRFDNPINGLGYYDNYYTNSYWYNQNPYNYGVSVYNGYGWWGNNYNNYSYNPSVMFYQNWGWGNNGGWGNNLGWGNNGGWGNNPGWGYNGYNPYNPYGNSYWLGYNQGYNNGYFNGWNGYPYNNGFGNGNPYFGNNYPFFNNNGWGYFNMFDNNSRYTYAPRSSHGGSNSERTSNPGVNGGEYFERHISNVVAQQDKAVKFSEIPNVRVNEVNAYQYNAQVNETLKNTIKNSNSYGNSNTPTRNPSNWNNTTPIEDKKSIEIIPPRSYSNQPSSPTKQYEIKTVQPVRQNSDFNQSQPTRIKTEPKRENYSAPNKQSDWNNRPSNNSTPTRAPGSGSGTGVTRPR